MTTTAQATRLHTIGSVCRRLQGEFSDISISKIRYLEDQGLLAPKRTRGGYRLFSEEDVERLETILRLQRDEFLPLRVIRQELASPREQGPQTPPHAGSPARIARSTSGSCASARESAPRRRASSSSTGCSSRRSPRRTPRPRRCARGS